MNYKREDVSPHLRASHITHQRLPLQAHSSVDDSYILREPLDLHIQQAEG